MSVHTEGLTSARNRRHKTLPAFSVPAPTISFSPTQSLQSLLELHKTPSPTQRFFFSPLGSLNKRTHPVPTVDLNCALLSCNPLHGDVCDDNLTSHFDFLLSVKSYTKRQMQPCGSIRENKTAHRNQDQPWQRNQQNCS